ncbi:MAG: SRPBCC family protein [Bacteroidia bacterium]
MKTYYLIIILLALNTAKAKVPSTFSHTDSSVASPEAIWAVWTDVSSWHRWDSGLRSASLKDGQFRLGAKGHLRPDKGPRARFRISALQEGKSYTLETAIPFGKLIVERSLEVKSGKTFFTHTVRFTGLLKGFFSKKLGARYEKMLPGVMHTIKDIAEQS